MLDLNSASYADVRPRKPTLLHRLDLWMINDGKRYLYFGMWIVIQVLLFSIAFVNYKYNPMWQNEYRKLGSSFLAARSAALALHVDTALVLFPICRTIISWIRKTPLNRLIPFDHALLFHKVIGWSILLFTLIHTGSHYRNYWVVNQLTGVSYVRIMFTTGHGITGHIMLLCILLMSITGYKKIRHKHFNLFWNIHHLYIVYFACFSIHGAFCLLKPNSPPYCKSGGSFWKYWIASGVLYLFERLSRELRANRRAKDMKIQKVILHPGNVIEVQFRKLPSFKALAGQYIFLNCPAASTNQWHPFTLTSAPEEDYVSVHIRVVGDWTRSFAASLGARPEHWMALEQSKDEEQRQHMSRHFNRYPGDTNVNKSFATGVDSEKPHSSIGFAPLTRRRKNTGLSQNRPNTMLLIDQTESYIPLSNYNNRISRQSQPRASSNFMSRISGYFSNVGTSTHMSGRSSFHPLKPLSSKEGDPSVPPVPPMPTLQQLQDYYLCEDAKDSDFTLQKPSVNTSQISSSVKIAEREQASKANNFSLLGRNNLVKDTQSTYKDNYNTNSNNSNAISNLLIGGSNSIGGDPAITQVHSHANILPQVLIDGPFGSASEDVFNHEIAMLFCAGIGCTPFASVLKSIWYRLSYPEGSFRLRKVYFFWVQRDTKSFEWFQDLLKAIEEEDDMRTQKGEDMHTLYLRNSDEKMIEIHTYLTGNLNITQMAHIHLDEGELDPITGLRSPTNFGRPNVDLIFRAVSHSHPASDVGVFFCGPHKLGSSIESAAKRWSSDGQDGTKFFYNKENF